MANKVKLINLASKAMSRGQWDKAVQTLERVLAEDPQDVRTRLKLGDVYAKKGDREHACEVYREVAETHAEQGFFLKAVAVYKSVLKIDPQQGEAALRIAELHEQLGLAQDAMVHFQLALPVLEAQGQSERVLQVLERIIDLDGDNVAARIKLAETLSRSGRREDAVTHFSAAAATLKQQARIEDYVKVAERLIYHDASRFDVVKDLAQLYLGRGDTKRGLAKLQICFKESPRDIETLTLLAKAFADLGQVQKTVYVYRELARVHEEEGRIAEAREVYRVILQHQPDDGDALRALGMDDGLGAPSMPISMPPSMDLPSPDNATGALPIDASQDLREPRIGAPQEARFPTDDLRPASLYSSSDAAPGIRPITSDLSLAAPPPSTSASESDVERFIREAEVYIRYNLPGKAIEHLEQAARADPTSILPFRKLYDVCLSMNDAARAADALASAAQVCELNGDHAGAEAMRNDLAHLSPGHPFLRGIPAPPSSAFQSPDSVSVDLSEGSVDINPSDVPDLIDIEAPEEFDIDTGEFRSQEPWALSEPPAAPRPRPDSWSASRTELDPRVALNTFAGSRDLGEPERDPISEAAMEVDADQLEAAEMEPEFLEAIEEEARPEPLPAPPPLPPEALPDEPVEAWAIPRGGSNDWMPTPERPVSEVEEDESFDLEDAVAALEAAGRGQRGRASSGPTLDGHEPASEPILLLTDAVEEPSDVTAPQIPPEEPAPAEPAHPDLSDELEEVRFFLENDLFEEALEALEGLEPQYPGHPELARLRSLAQPEAAAPEASESPEAEDEGPVPLLDDAPEQAGFFGGDNPLGLLDEDADDALSFLDQPSFPSGDVPTTVDPADGDYDQGMAYKQIGQYDEAIEHFRAAANASPARAADALEMVSRCLMEAGRTEEGIRVLEEALEHAENGPAEADLRYEIADAYERLGDKELALAWFESCRGLAPAHRDVDARIRVLDGEDDRSDTAAPIGGDTPSALPQRRSKISYL